VAGRACPVTTEPREMTDEDDVAPALLTAGRDAGFVSVVVVGAAPVGANDVIVVVVLRGLTRVPANYDKREYVENQCIRC
jgi:hypothetical protein